MHQAVLDWVKGTLSNLPARQQVVELGSYNINGSVRPLFGEAAYTGVDIRPGLGVDVVADATTYKPESHPDTVICCEVLEHTPDAAAIIANAFEILAPGGLLLLTMAMNPRIPHSAVDGLGVRPGEHYQNISPDELSAWLESFTAVQIEKHPARGDLYALAFKPEKAKETSAPAVSTGKKKAKSAPENKMITTPEDKEENEPGNAE